MVWLSLLVAFDDAFVCEGVVWDVEGKLICCVAQQNPQSRELIPSFLMLHLQPTTNLKDKCQSYQEKSEAFQKTFILNIDYSIDRNWIIWKLSQEN